jgi:hypothetical protein
MGLFKRRNQMKKSYVKVEKYKGINGKKWFGLSVYHYNKKDKTLSGIHTSLSESMGKTLIKKLLNEIK